MISLLSNLSEGISANSWAAESSSKVNASSMEGRVGKAEDKNMVWVVGNLSVTGSL